MSLKSNFRKDVPESLILLSSSAINGWMVLLNRPVFLVRTEPFNYMVLVNMVHNNETIILDHSSSKMKLTPLKFNVQICTLSWKKDNNALLANVIQPFFSQRLYVSSLSYTDFLPIHQFPYSVKQQSAITVRSCFQLTVYLQRNISIPPVSGCPERWMAEWLVLLQGRPRYMWHIAIWQRYLSTGNNKQPEQALYNQRTEIADSWYTAPDCSDAI